MNREEVEKFCQSKNIKHVEVSAKSGEHVNIAFQEISDKLTKIYPKEERTKDGNSVLDDIKKKRKDFQLKAGGESHKPNNKC